MAVFLFNAVTNMKTIKSYQNAIRFVGHIEFTLIVTKTISVTSAFLYYRAGSSAITYPVVNRNCSTSTCLEPLAYRKAA